MRVTVRGSPNARGLTPRAVVGARPLQDFQVPRFRRFRAGGLVPKAVVLAQPFEDVQVSPPSRGGARRPVAGAAVLLGPLQEFQMALRGGVCGRACLPAGPLRRNPR